MQSKNWFNADLSEDLLPSIPREIASLTWPQDHHLLDKIVRHVRHTHVPINVGSKETCWTPASIRLYNNIGLSLWDYMTK